MEQISTAMGNASVNVPIFHLNELSGIIDDSLNYAFLEDNRIDRPSELAFNACPHKAWTEIGLRRKSQFVLPS